MQWPFGYKKRILWNGWNITVFHLAVHVGYIRRSLERSSLGGFTVRYEFLSRGFCNQHLISVVLRDCPVAMVYTVFTLYKTRQRLHRSPRNNLSLPRTADNILSWWEYFHIELNDWFNIIKPKNPENNYSSNGNYSGEHPTTWGCPKCGDSQGTVSPIQTFTSRRHEYLSLFKHPVHIIMRIRLNSEAISQLC